MRLVIVFLAGCESSATPGGVDDGEPAVEDVADGTRLRAIYRVAPDGAAEWTGRFVDTDVDEECSWRRGGDGVTRCLPVTVDAFTGAYADAGCTEPAVLEQGEPPRQFTVEHDWTACDADLPYLRVVTTRRLDGATEYYEQLNGLCDGPHPLPADVALRVVDDELPPTAFVAATVTGGDRATRVDREVLVGDDGSSSPHPLIVDGWLDLHCAVRELADGWSCQPSLIVEAPVFDDDACSVPLAWDARTCSADDRELGSVTTGSLVTYYRLGDRTVPTAIHDDFGAGCSAIIPPYSGTYWELTDESVVDFAQLTAGAVDTPRRLQPLAWYAVDGSSVIDGARHRDSARGEVCATRAVADGERCLPLRIGGITDAYFADPGCTTPVTVGGYSRAPYGHAPDYLADYSSDPAIGLVVERIFVAGPPHDGALYMTDGDLCFPADGQPGPWWPWFEIGEEVALAEFESLTTQLR